MKTNKVLFLAGILAVGLSASAQAGSHNGGSGSTAAPASGRGSSGSAARPGSAGFHYGGGPMMSSQRFSSFRGVTSGQRRFTPGAVTGSYNPARFANAHSRNLATARSNNHFNSNRNGNGRLVSGDANNHVFARRSANWHSDWNRHSDHWWNGHRCRFVNGSWFIFDFGFYPWDGYPYDYYASDYYPYPYGYGYGYGYGPGVYEGGANPNYEDQGVDQSSYYQNTDSTVAAIQERLARQGYYRGQIDGVLGPATHRALMSYQRRNGLRATGSLTGETLQSLNLRTVDNRGLRG